MPAYLIVFLGAGLGGALRHGVNVAALRLLGSGFPYGTLTVNMDLRAHSCRIRRFRHARKPESIPSTEL
jgi:hypothetical protein